jgi:hypothetical protein
MGPCAAVPARSHRCHDVLQRPGEGVDSTSREPFRALRNEHGSLAMLARTLVLHAAVLALITQPATAGDDPHADGLISYGQGTNPASGFTDPATALGPPERFTGEGVFPTVVSAFNPPFGTDEIVSIGAGGHLAVSFDTPVTDDPGNPFGIDLLIFGNAGFIDDSFPNSTVGGLFGDDGGVIEVSPDGITWFVIVDVRADGLFPTIGWLDAGPYDTEPGTMPTDFTRPVDPSLLVDDFMGLTNTEVITLYGGSGGGAGVDIGAVGLSAICCVRIVNADTPETPNIEIDAFADVAPAPNPADVDGDGMVGINDFLIVLGSWGPCPDPCPPSCAADVDDDCTVGITDFLIVLGAWGT